MDTELIVDYGSRKASCFKGCKWRMVKKDRNKKKYHRGTDVVTIIF